MKKEPMETIKLLVIEDEKAIRDMLRFALPSNEFSLEEADNCERAINSLAKQVPDLIILDWMLPDKSGVDFLKWAKKQNDYKSIPIIMLTAKAEEENKIKGLSHGADDYITKPFSPRELMARIKAILRRGPILSPDNQLTHKNISLDLNKHETMIDNTVIELTAIEFKMLAFFLKNPNQTFSRDQLITHIWGSSTYIEERTVDGLLRRLRDKLKQHGHENLISTVRGIGYQFRQ